MERFDILYLRLQEKVLNSRNSVCELDDVGVSALCYWRDGPQTVSMYQVHGAVVLVLDILGVHLLVVLAQGTDVAARPRDSIGHALGTCPLKLLHVGEARDPAVSAKRSYLFALGKQQEGMMMPCKVPHQYSMCPDPDRAAAPRRRPSQRSLPFSRMVLNPRFFAAAEKPVTLQPRNDHDGKSYWILLANLIDDGVT